MADVQMTKIRYRLVGPNAGRTVVLGKKFKFTDGVLEVEVREDQTSKFAGLGRHLARAYNAHPEGSAALERAEATWAEHNGGKSATRQAAKSGKAKADGAPADGKAGDGAKAGSKGHGAEAGDGEDSGDGDEDVSTEMTEEQQALYDALGDLDPADDAHWTKTGLPNLKVLGEALGRNVGRAEIEEIVPGFNRESAAGTEEDGE